MRRESAPKFWRVREQYYRIVGVKCTECGKVYFPPVLRCGSCGSRKMEPLELSNRGKLISASVLHQVPAPFEKAKPLVLGLVELENGIKMLAQIVDTDGEVKPGTEVEMVVRRVCVDGRYGLIKYGYKFRPVRART